MSFYKHDSTNNEPRPSQQRIDSDKTMTQATPESFDDWKGAPHLEEQAELRTENSLLRRTTLDLVSAFAEFLGTFMFLWLAFMGTQSAQFNNHSTDPAGLVAQDNQTILYIALSFGMSLIVVAWVFFRISGAAFNPAVTFALWLVGGCTFTRAVITIVAQLLGGIAAAGLASALTLRNFSVANALTDGVGAGQGLVIEMLTTGLLVFTVLMMAAEKHKATFLAPIAIGLAVFIGHLASLGWTGAGMNPARTFGPQVITRTFSLRARWVYYIGQILGSIVATLVYAFVKMIRYEDIATDIDTSSRQKSQSLQRSPLAKVFRLNRG